MSPLINKKVVIKAFPSRPVPSRPGYPFRAPSYCCSFFQPQQPEKGMTKPTGDEPKENTKTATTFRKTFPKANQPQNANQLTNGDCAFYDDGTARVRASHWRNPQRAHSLIADSAAHVPTGCQAVPEKKTEQQHSALPPCWQHETGAQTGVSH